MELKLRKTDLKREDSGLLIVPYGIETIHLITH